MGDPLSSSRMSLHRKLPEYNWSCREAVCAVFSSPTPKREYARSKEELESIREIDSFKEL